MTSVTIADSIRSNGITYRCITDYIYYILLNYCITPQSHSSIIRVYNSSIAIELNISICERFKVIISIISRITIRKAHRS